MTKPPRAISGRWFVLGFGSLLVLSVIIGFSVVIRFQKIMTALDEVRRLWPKAAVVLEERYRQCDSLIANPDTMNAGGISVDSLEWQQARDRFRSSTQYDVQARAVASLEAVADRLIPPAAPLPPAAADRDAVRSFIDADRTLERLQSDGLGQMCSQLFRMNIPDRIYASIE